MSDYVRGTTCTPERVYRPHFVYIVWRDRLPIYVGCTNDVPRRLKEHRQCGRLWDPPTFRVEVMEFPDMLSARSAESNRIQKLRPAQNIRCNPRATDLLDVMYVDEYPADLLDRLVEDRRRIFSERHAQWARNQGYAS